MAKRRRPQTVHVRNPWATGTVGSMMELIRFLKRHPFESALAIIERIVRWMIRHYRLTLSAATGILAWRYTYVDAAIGILATTILIYIGAKYWKEWKNFPSPTFWGLTQGLWRMGRVRRKWEKASKAAGFTTKPRLKKLEASPNGVNGTVVTSNVGTSISKLVEGSDEIASIFRANDCKFDFVKPGEANMHVVWGDPTTRLLTLHDIEQSADNKTVGFGLDPDGYPVSISLTTSLLIVGESESGKSNALWAIIGGLLAKDIPFRVRVIDPAGGVELNRLQTHLSPLCLSYTDSAVDIDQLVVYTQHAMYQRMEAMKERNDRKHEPTVEEPLEILLIDELLLLKNHDAQSPLAEIVSTGRKASHIVIALSQLSQVDALGRVRDLFPQRICMATKSSDMTDSVLGPGAERDGAKCSRISKGSPGVGYYYHIDRRVFTRFRTPEVLDAEADLIAKGHFPERRQIKRRPARGPKNNRHSLAKRKTCVYRLFDKTGTLLYIGKTVNPNQRFKQHAEEQIWWPQVDMSKTQIVWYPNWDWAGKVEVASIKAERPRFNIIGAPLAMSVYSRGEVDTNGRAGG